MAADPIRFSPLTIDFRIPDDGTPTLICRGKLNSESAELFKNEVKKWIPRSKVVIVDLSEIRAIDSSGLGTIVSTYVSAKYAGCELKLINLSQRLKDLFQISRIASLFESIDETA